jgi:hypothetical protein
MFSTRQGQNIRLADSSGQPPRISETAYKIGVGAPGLAAQLVIEVCHMQPNASIWPCWLTQALEKMQQANRIRSTGHADHYNAARREQALLINGGSDGRQQPGIS